MALIDAVKARDYDKTSALIGEGANINQQDEQGWTPLNFAAGKRGVPTHDPRSTSHALCIENH